VGPPRPGCPTVAGRVSGVGGERNTSCDTGEWRAMDSQLPEDAVPSAFVTESSRRSLSVTPPVTGAWRTGDPPGDRSFVSIGDLALERGGEVPNVTIAFETWGELNADRSNAVLVLHALTGDSHVIGAAGPGHPTAGW